MSNQIAHFYITSNKVNRAWVRDTNGNVSYMSWQEAVAMLNVTYGLINVYPGEGKNVYKPAGS